MAIVYVKAGDVGVAFKAGVDIEKPAFPYTVCKGAGRRPPEPCRSGGWTGVWGSGRFWGREPLAMGMRDIVAQESARWRDGWMMMAGLGCGTGRRGIS